MRLSIFLLASVAAVASLPGISRAGADPAKPGGSENAALQYWQAFALMPTLDKDQEKLVEKWNSVPLDEAAKALVSRSQSSLKFLRRAAKLPRCDWGLDYDSGIAMQLPHLAKARLLARLAALSIRSELALGEQETARENARALMVLARHVSSDPLLISILVRYAIEATVLDVVAPHVPDLKESPAQIAAQYRSLPKGATLQQAMVGEKDYMARSIIALLEAAERNRKGGWREEWKRIVDLPEVPDSVKAADSLEAAIKQISDLFVAYDELAAIVALPPKEFDARYPPFIAKTKAAHPIANLLIPSMDKIIASQRRQQARLAMLLAAIAVAQDGPEKLKDYPDPFGSGPFEYKALDKGFELKSKLIHDNKPVTLVVGQPGKS